MTSLMEWYNSTEIPAVIRDGCGTSVDVLVHDPESDEHTIAWFHYGQNEWLFLCREMNFKKFDWRYFTDEHDRAGKPKPTNFVVAGMPDLPPLQLRIVEHAVFHDWRFVGHNIGSSLLSFKKPTAEGVKMSRMDIYYKSTSTLENFMVTVGTSIDHPKKGKTQLFRRNISEKQLVELLTNPRKHTGRGYYNK